MKELTVKDVVKFLVHYVRELNRTDANMLVVERPNGTTKISVNQLRNCYLTLNTILGGELLNDCNE